MQILRRADFKMSAWKNGGGRTHEVFRAPALGEPFLWRLSLAEVASSGPFSDFSGYQRLLTLLDGAFTLRFSDGEHVKLDRVGDLVRFDGARGVQCELAGRPSTDLNLIVAHGLRPVTAQVADLAAPLAVHLVSGATLVVFAVAGAVEIVGAPGTRLETWDAAIDSGAATRVVRVASAPDSPSARVFLAEFGDTGTQTASS